MNWRVSDSMCICDVSPRDRCTPFWALQFINAAMLGCADFYCTAIIRCLGGVLCDLDHAAQKRIYGRCSKARGRAVRRGSQFQCLGVRRRFAAPGFFVCHDACAPSSCPMCWPRRFLRRVCHPRQEGCHGGG
ncbi:MAG: hypothetical protein ACI8V2_003361 [Candidatus Latescibacterota bacterium]|jgi:hypothetical protein